MRKNRKEQGAEVATKGVCELCGFADDSYRIEENGAVMKVCKFCHDGYLERKQSAGQTSATDVPPDETVGLPFDDIPPDDLKEIERELALQKKSRKVAALDEAQLGLVLAPTEDDKRVLSNVRRRQLRKEKRAAAKGEQVAWEDVSEEEEEEAVPLSPTASDPELTKKQQKKNAGSARAQKQLDKIKAEAAEQQKILRTRIQGILDTLEIDGVLDEDGTQPEQVSATMEQTPQTDGNETSVSSETAVTYATEAEEAPTEAEEAPAAAEEAPAEAWEGPPKAAEADDADGKVTEQSEASEEAAAEEAAEPAAQESENPNTEEQQETEQIAAMTAAHGDTETEGSKVAKGKENENEICAESKEARAREKVLAAVNQTIDDERIKITSPEVEICRDKRPKTNLDVAISEYVGGVRFLDAFKYVLHKVSYTVFLALIVLAVSTVMFVMDGWQRALIVFGGGAGATGLGFLLMWYLSHCYALDRRALLLRIRQQEILFESMDTDCYRELRTKFTMIKALGWLLNKLSVLLPLVIAVGGNVAAVIVGFRTAYYWLFPVVSAASSVAAVLVYYLIKFAADCVAYALDRERNQQIQQQTMLDMLKQLKK